MAVLLPNGKQSFTTGAGLPLVGGRVYTYAAGTNVPAATFADAAGTIPNTNPVILDARGEATIFWAGAYKVVLRDLLDNLIWSIDNIVTSDSVKDALAAAGGSALVGWQQGGTGALARTLQARLRDEAVFVTDFGAQAGGASGFDNLTAFNRAIDRGLALNKPIYVPGAPDSYGVSQTIQPVTGIIGDGKNQSRISAAMSTSAYFNQMLDAYNRRPIVRMGWKRSENGSICNVPMRGIAVTGPNPRPGTRQSNPPASFAWVGDGILFDEMAAFIQAYDVSADFCYKGFVHGNTNGHIHVIDANASNNWFNVYHEYGSGDIRYINSVLTGAQFASVGGHSNNKIPGLNTGGFVGLLFVGVHLGFSPYVFYQPDGGDGSVGLLGVTMLNSSAEQVGNAFYKGGSNPQAGTRRVTSGVTLITPGNIWTDAGGDYASYLQYTIIGDANYPAREPMRLDLVQGDPLSISGGTLQRGTFNGTVAHTIINDLLAWAKDDTDAGGIVVNGQGRERVVGMRQSATVFSAVAGFTANVGGSYVIGLFSVPGDCGQVAYMRFRARFNATGVTAGKFNLSCFVDGQPAKDGAGNVIAPQVVTIIAGDQDVNIDIVQYVSPREVTGAVAHTVRFNLQPQSGSATLSSTSTTLEMLQTGLVN